MEKVSVVSTMFKSEEYIDEFYHHTIATIKTTGGLDYEFILVDDGSPDNSLQKAVALHEKDDKVKVIQLSRNFGHHKAIMTGLAHTKGDYVFFIDIDLEEEPELLAIFWHAMRGKENSDFDIVYGIQN